MTDALISAGTLLKHVDHAGPATDIDACAQPAEAYATRQRAMPFRMGWRVCQMLMMLLSPKETPPGARQPHLPAAWLRRLVVPSPLPVLISGIGSDQSATADAVEPRNPVARPPAATIIGPGCQPHEQGFARITIVWRRAAFRRRHVGDFRADLNPSGEKAGDAKAQTYSCPHAAIERFAAV